MTKAEHELLTAFRRRLRGTGLFCFEKGGKFMLYREVNEGRNTKVLVSADIHTFINKGEKCIGSRNVEMLAKLKTGS